MLQKHTLIDNEHIKIELEEGILISTWKDSFISLDVAREAVNLRSKVTEGRSYPILIKLISIKDSTKEARDFLASHQGCNGIVAGAIYVNSIVENVMASLFLFLNKPVVPTKIFHDEAKAKEWLADYVKKD